MMDCIEVEGQFYVHDVRKGNLNLIEKAFEGTGIVPIEYKEPHMVIDSRPTDRESALFLLFHVYEKMDLVEQKALQTFRANTYLLNAFLQGPPHGRNIRE